MGQLQPEDAYDPAERRAAPDAASYLEAVVAHEIAHAVHPNHSPASWDLLRRVCPETGRAKAFLDGVSWLAHNRERLPPVEREFLGEIGREEGPRRY